MARASSQVLKAPGAMCRTSTAIKAAAAAIAWLQSRRPSKVDILSDTDDDDAARFNQ